MCDQILHHIASYKQVPTYEELQADEELMKMMEYWCGLRPADEVEKVEENVEKKKEKKEQKVRVTKPKLSDEQRQDTEVDHDRCLCRIWKGGLDNIQCSRKKKVGDFCTAHGKVGAEWWCGLITEPRPEEPCLPCKKDPSAPPARHYWKGQEKPEKKKKTPVKKDTEKKVRKVKKESPKKVTIAEEPEFFGESAPDGAGVGLLQAVDDLSKDMDNIVKEGAKALKSIISEKSVVAEPESEDDIPSDIDSDEEAPPDVEIENVIYKLLPDDMVVDRVTGRQMGYLIDGEVIDFIGPEQEEIHEQNKQ
jgi:hypothetical protein